MKKKNLVLVGLMLAAGFIRVAQANDKDKKNEFDFLYPGFHFLIQPGSEGGQSISALYDGEGFILCYSGVNPSNEVVTAPFHCNNRITDPGFHVPADVLFGKTGFKQKTKTFLKWLYVAGPQAAQAFANEMPLISEVSSGSSNVTQGSGAQQPLEQYQLSKTLGQVKFYAKKGEKNCDGSFPTALAPFFMADLVKDIQDRVRDFEKRCEPYKKIEFPDNATPAQTEKYDEALFCHQQKHNQQMAANVMEICNIPSISAQAGEPGNNELWYPGQSVPQSCIKALNDMGSVTVKDPKDGSEKTIHLKAAEISWLGEEQAKLKGIAPTTADQAVADHAGKCLANNANPEVIEKLLREEKEAEAVHGDPDPVPAATTAPAASADASPAPVTAEAIAPSSN